MIPKDAPHQSEAGYPKVFRNRYRACFLSTGISPLSPPPRCVPSDEPVERRFQKVSAGRILVRTCRLFDRAEIIHDKRVFSTPPPTPISFTCQKEQSVRQESNLRVWSNGLPPVLPLPTRQLAASFFCIPDLNDDCSAFPQRSRTQDLYQRTTPPTGPSSADRPSPSIVERSVTVPPSCKPPPNASGRGVS
jgi:hypothetical protein